MRGIFYRDLSLLKYFPLFLLLAIPLQAQSWSGILSSSRAIDWSQAGLPATFPDGETTLNPWTPPTRTQCGPTLTPSGGDDTPQILAAFSGSGGFSSCTPPYAVLLGSGNFQVNSDLRLGSTNYNRNNITLRGSGPQVTTATLSSSAHWETAGCCVGAGAAALTSASANYTVGQTTLLLQNANATLFVGAIAHLVQCDSGFSSSNPGFPLADPPDIPGTASCTGAAADSGQIFHCSDAICAQPGNGNHDANREEDRQTVRITSVNGNTVTISPGIYLSDWKYSQGATLAWYSNSSYTSAGIGIEDMTIKVPNNSGHTGVLIGNGGYAHWLKGNRIMGFDAANSVLAYIAGCSHCLMANNYFFGNDPANMTGGFSLIGKQGNSSDSLWINNISSWGAFLDDDGYHSGEVVAYNFSTIDCCGASDGGYQATIFEHTPGSQLLLRESNQLGRINDDDTYTSHNLNTDFRNNLNCGDTPYVINSKGGGFQYSSFARFANAIGNAIGQSGSPASNAFCTAYQGQDTDRYVWNLNAWGTDPLTVASLMRWGNVDQFNGVRFVASEVPTNSQMPSSTYPNAAYLQNNVPANQNLPCSFFLKGYSSTTCTPHFSGGTGLGWWKVCTNWTTFPTVCAVSRTPPFPANGPDVLAASGAPANYANDVPAAIAWKNLPTDTTLQNSYTITASSWTSGVETLTVTTPVPVQGGFNISSSGACLPSSGSVSFTGRSDNEILATSSTSSQVQYALASNPGTNACNGTMKWPNVRQFDERVYQNDSSGGWNTLGTMASCTGSPTGQYTQTAGSYPCFRSQAPAVFIPASALGTAQGHPIYMFADGLTKQSEWGNNFYTYDPTQGTATGAFSVLWQSLNEEGSGNQALSTIARASGVVTGTVPTTGQAPRSFQVGDWIFPNGVTYGGATPFNTMMQVASVSNCVTANLACSTFTANQAGEDGTGTGGNVYGPAPRFANLGSCPSLPCGPTGPLPRHNQVTVYDTTRNAVWMWGGICDTVAAPGSASTATVVGVHGGCYEMYEMTKSGGNWAFTQVHGFGTTAFNIAAPNQAEPGLACTSSSNAGNCGFKFSWGGYDPTNDVIVLFGGTFNSSPRSETYVYHPGTDVLNVVCAEVGTPTCSTVPPARSAYGDSRLVSIGGGRLLLFGGQAAGSTNNQLGDTWIFNTTNNTWSQPASANGANPSPGLTLANLPAVMDWDPVLGKVIAVDANPAGSHTWAFDPTALTWTDLNIANGPVLDNTNTLLPEYIGVIDPDYPLGGNGSMIIVNRTAATGVNTFFALSLPSATGPTGQIFNLSAQRITWPSTNGTRPSGPSTNQTNVPVTFAVPVPDSFVFGTLGSCPNGVALYQNSVRVNSQCRMIAGWPDSKSGSTYNAQFIQLDYQYPSFTEGTADTSFVVTFEGAGSGNNPSTSMGVACTGAGTPNAACQNSNQLLVATGAANYLFKITNTNIVDDLAIGTTHVICSASTVATGCLNHGANDGIVLFGPPSGQTTPHTVSCPLPAGGSGNGDSGASACTNAYLTSNDASSTAVFEENGPMRTVVKINANLIDGSANNYNEAVTCRITLWANRVDASFECALRNANYSVTANDAVSAYKMHASMYLQYTVSLSTTANTTATFGNHTATPSTISMSATQGGYLTTGHMKYMEDFFFGGNLANCPLGGDHDANCAWAPISRTPGAYPTGSTYTQEGYVVTATGGATVTGTASGTNVQIPPGWSDVTDANGVGVEVGEFLMAAYWPASQEFQSGGTVVRVGLNPDESLFGTGGEPYIMGWPKYTLYRSYLNPHVSALTNTKLSDSFLAWQLPVVGEYASPASYNGAKDNAFGRLALLYPLPDPVVFDNYAITLGGYCPSGVAGSCLPDIGGQGYTGNATIEDGNQAGTMTRFRYYPWGDGGGANQQEWAFSLLNNWLSWKTGGRYMQSWLWYWYVLEGAMPRADWVTVPGGSAAANEQGWRCASALNCPDIASVPCAALHCANEDNYGHPAQTNINLNGTGLNVAQRNWTPNADNGQHYHWYGMAQFYELTGWEWAKDFLLQAGKDELLNANAIVNDATRSGGGDFIFADRVFGHRWMAYSRLSMFLCAVGDPDCDGNNGSNVSPKALTNAENHAAYGANPNLVAFGYPLQSGGTPVAQPTGCTTPTTDWGAGCSQGISPVTGFSYGGDENDNALASPSLAPLDNGVHRISQSFFWDRKVNGLLELEWAELSARGAGWKVTNAKNGGVSFGDNCGTTYPCYSLPMLAYGISNSFTQNMYVLGSTFSQSGSVYVSYLDYLNSTCGTTHNCTTTQTPLPGNGACDNTALNSGFYCGTNGPPQNLATHWTHFATTCAFSGSTVNFDTADNPNLTSGQWQQKFEFLMQRLNTGQSFSEDRSYDLTWAWDCVRKHNPTIASFPLASNIATMQTVTITVTDGTHTGYCIGACTITWTKPLNLSISGVSLPQGNVFYQLVVNECVPGTFGCPSPAGFPIANWLPFYRNCTTTSTTNECTANTGLLANNPCNGGLNATDQTSGLTSGCWGSTLPTASTNFFTATPIANPGALATSASFTCPASNVCTFALKGALTQVSAILPAPAPGLFGK